MGLTAHPAQPTDMSSIAGPYLVKQEDAGLYGSWQSVSWGSLHMHAAQVADTSKEPGVYLVEQEDAGLGEDGAGDGDPLRLAAAEADPPLAYLGAVALRERADELVRVCQHRRPLHL